MRVCYTYIHSPSLHQLQYLSIANSPGICIVQILISFSELNIEYMFYIVNKLVQKVYESDPKYSSFIIGCDARRLEPQINVEREFQFQTQ